jgi:hypothetical protein
MADAPIESGWEPGWEGHRRAQMLRLARLPLAEKLQWLEEAQKLVEALRGGREPRAKRDP